ncbi:hypothetical protein [Sulfitobacter sp.]|uniref:hypothetical protein n=1 Tax=Sulfitobacter sp. TaxID=1903071 RepID=UPI003F6A89EE
MRLMQDAEAYFFRTVRLIQFLKTNRQRPLTRENRMTTLSCVDGSLFASPFSRMVFRQKQSCVRPVSATHMAAGPDGFHQPSPIPHIEQQAFWTKLGVPWFLG